LDEAACLFGYSSDQWMSNTPYPPKYYTLTQYCGESLVRALQEFMMMVFLHWTKQLASLATPATYAPKCYTLTQSQSVLDPAVDDTVTSYYHLHNINWSKAPD
jgi:hypothetical protein